MSIRPLIFVSLLVLGLGNPCFAQSPVGLACPADDVSGLNTLGDTGIAIGAGQNLRLELLQNAIESSKIGPEKEEGICSSCKTSGQYVKGNCPSNAESPISSPIWFEDRDGNLVDDQDVNDDGRPDNGAAAKANAIIDLLRQFGINPESLCQGKCPPDPGSSVRCLPEGLINPSGDGIKFWKWCTPWDGPENATRFYCRYVAELQDCSRTPRFQASSCTCFITR